MKESAAIRNKPKNEEKIGLEIKNADNMINEVNPLGPTRASTWDIEVFIQIAEINPHGKLKTKSDLKISTRDKIAQSIKSRCSLDFLLLFDLSAILLGLPT